MPHYHKKTLWRGEEDVIAEWYWELAKPKMEK